MRKLIFTCAALLAGSLAVAGTPTIDGTTTDAAYSLGILSTQTCGTGFGDSSAGTASTANGSELDNIKITSDATNLYIAIAGNFETNGNFCAIFFDTDNGGAGGGTSIASDNFNFAVGTTFPTGFTCEGFLLPNAGSGGQLFMNQGKHTGSNAYTMDFLGSVAAPTAGNPTIGSITSTPTGGTSTTWNLGLNNSNIAGVTSSAVTGAGSVTTGLEIGIPYTYLTYLNNGVTINGASTIKLFAVTTGASSPQTFSNQVLPGLPLGTANLGTAPNLSTANAGGNIGVITYAIASSVPDWSTISE